MTRRCRDNRATHALDRLRGVRAGERAGQKPDRDRVAGRFVLGGTHDPEGAGPELANDPVTTLDTQPDRSAVDGVDRGHGPRFGRVFVDVFIHEASHSRSISRIASMTGLISEDFCGLAALA